MTMLPDLAHLIRLQQIETSASDARATLAGIPARRDETDATVAAGRAAVAAASASRDDNRTTRARLEANLAEVKTRVDRYRDQLMAVKTTKELHAMQAEIAAGNKELQRLEDLVLERMLEADELAIALAGAEKNLAETDRAAQATRSALEQEHGTLTADLERLETDRAAVAERLPAGLRDLYHQLARGRRGLAVVEARDGLCRSCQVRLRPQLFNDIRLNRRVIQCESCQRILYFDETRAVAK